MLLPSVEASRGYLRLEREIEMRELSFVVESGPRGPLSRPVKERRRKGLQ